MYFKDKYKPIPNLYNLVLAMLWRHPENVELDKVQVVHYCAAVSVCIYLCRVVSYMNLFDYELVMFVGYTIGV